jgi:hypothetical protein
VYRAIVLRRGGRWRADLPGGFAIFFAIAFVVGLKQDIREALPAAVWGSGALTLGLAGLWYVGWRSLQWLLVVDQRGVRMTNRAGRTIDLGRPRRIAHGRCDVLVSAGHMHRNAPQLWVSIETTDDRTFVFQRAMGVLDGLPGWPEARSPVTRDTFSSLGFDPVAFHAAATAVVAAA